MAPRLAGIAALGLVLSVAGGPVAAAGSPTVVAVTSSSTGLPTATAPAPAQVADTNPTFDDAESVPGPIVIETIDPGRALEPEVIERVEALDAELQVRSANATVAPERSAASGSDLTVTFDSNVPATVRELVTGVVAQWDDALHTPVPVKVTMSWDCFGDFGVLGYASATDIYISGNEGYGFPVALANQLAGRDLNGSTPEVRIVLNAELAADNDCSYASDTWHFGADAPPADKIDFSSVVLHEVAHGLGFLGSAWRSPGTVQPELDTPPYSYDSHVHTASGPLLSQVNPNGYLTSPLTFDIGGGRLWDLYSPGTFLNGSSFSHFSASSTSDNRGGALMNHELRAGVAFRNIDAAVLGVLAEQGWGIEPAPVTPSPTVSVSEGSMTLTIDGQLATYGAAPTSYRITAARDGIVDADLTVAAGQSRVVLSPLYNSVAYDLSITPSAGASSGVPFETTITMPTVPNRPTLVTATGTGLDQTVAWAAPVGANGSEVYRVEQRRIGGSWTTVGETGQRQLNTGALTEGVYQFRVSATSAGRRGPTGSSLLIGVSPGLVRPFPLDGEVGRLFSAYFLRQPDRAGYDYWTMQRAGGRSLAAISADFEQSAEFVNRYGTLSNRAFVNLVYENVLGRSNDTAGSDYWTSLLDRGEISRGETMIGFSQSPEYLAFTGTAAPTSSLEGRISRLYFAFFLREPDQAGLDFWMGQAAGGSSLAIVAEAMAQSTEFSQRYGNLPDDRFVELVYGNVLVRLPDAAGRAHWISVLAGGTSRGEMMTGFSESPEFILRTGSIP